MSLHKFLFAFICAAGVSVHAQYVTPAGKQANSILLYGGIAHIGDGTVIEKSAIALIAGKISFVKDLSKETIDKAAFTEIIDISGKQVYPGIIAPSSIIGLEEISAVRATLDDAEVGRINPNVRSAIAYNTDSKIIPTVRSNGILVAQVTPRGGLISGTSSIMELDGWNWEDALLKADDGVHLNWPTMFRRSGGEDDPGNIEKNKEYEKQIAPLTKIFADAKAYNEGSQPEKDLKLESMRGLFNGTKNLYIHTNLSKEIIESVNFAKKSGVKKIIIVGGKDSWKITGFLKENNVPVLLCRLHELPDRSDDAIDAVYTTAAFLQNEGILFALNYEGSMEAIGMRNLPFVAGTAVAYGLTKEQALMSITYNTAKILSIDDRIGSIAAGKDATLFISTGDALDMKTNNVELAYIRGKKIMLDNEQKMLYNVYKNKYGIK